MVYEPLYHALLQFHSSRLNLDIFFWALPHRPAPSFSTLSLHLALRAHLGSLSKCIGTPTLARYCVDGILISPADWREFGVEISDSQQGKRLHLFRRSWSIYLLNFFFSCCRFLPFLATLALVRFAKASLISPCLSRHTQAYNTLWQTSDPYLYTFLRRERFPVKPPCLKRVTLMDTFVTSSGFSCMASI